MISASDRRNLFQQAGHSLKQAARALQQVGRGNNSSTSTDTKAISFKQPEPAVPTVPKEVPKEVVPTVPQQVVPTVPKEGGGSTTITSDGAASAGGSTGTDIPKGAGGGTGPDKTESSTCTTGKMPSQRTVRLCNSTEGWAYTTSGQGTE